MATINQSKFSAEVENAIDRMVLDAIELNSGWFDSEKAKNLRKLLSLFSEWLIENAHKFIVED